MTLMAGGDDSAVVPVPQGADPHVAVTVLPQQGSHSWSRLPSAHDVPSIAQTCNGDVELGPTSSAEFSGGVQSTAYVSSGPIVPSPAAAALGQHSRSSESKLRTAAADSDAESVTTEGDEKDICRICLFHSRDADEEARGIVVADMGEKDILVPLRCGCKVVPRCLHSSISPLRSSCLVCVGLRRA